jgi:hypothetical protein
VKSLGVYSWRKLGLVVAAAMTNLSLCHHSDGIVGRIAVGPALSFTREKFRMKEP